MSDSVFRINPQIDACLRRGDVAGAFGQPVAAGSSDPLASLFTARGDSTIAETSLYAGLTLGDFLYDYVRIDPTVVEGVDFARADDLDSVFSFSEFAARQMELPPEEFSGSLSQMQGYVAERLVALHLEVQGHDVTFPETSNQEGWDLLVDGDRFQVKCLGDAAGVHEHLRRFPDIPVIVNRELAESVGDHQGVYLDQALSHGDVVRMTSDSIEHGSELADFEIPWISLAVSSVFAARDLLTDKTTMDGALINLLTNTTGRIAIGTLGSVTAGMAGLLLFGPAGKLVFTGVGAVGGSWLGRKAAGSFRSTLLKKEEEVFHSAARDFAADAGDCVKKKLIAWNDKKGQLAGCFSRSHPNSRKAGEFVSKRMTDHLSYFENKARELDAMAGGTGETDPVGLWKQLLTLVKRAGLHPHTFQNSMRELGEAFRAYLAARMKYSL